MTREKQLVKAEILDGILKIEVIDLMSCKQGSLYRQKISVLLEE